MHILVATDGTLDADRAADAVARWHTDGDKVTILTVMNIPGEFFSGLRDSGVAAAAAIAYEAGQGIGDRAAEQLAKPHPVQKNPAMESPVLNALAKAAHERTDSIVKALDRRGVKAEAKWLAADNKTARSILSAIALHDTELLVIGSHGAGRFEGLLGSTGTKLVRRSPASVLVIRNEAEQ